MNSKRRSLPRYVSLHKDKRIPVRSQVLIKAANQNRSMFVVYIDFTERTLEHVRKALRSQGERREPARYSEEHFLLEHKARAFMNFQDETARRTLVEYSADEVLFLVSCG